MVLNAAWRYRKYKTCAAFQTECVWCGDSMVFYSVMLESGEPKGRLLYCGRKCQCEARWEGRKKLPLPHVVQDLYVMKGMSIPQIAKHFGCKASSVGKVLRDANTVMRKHTSVRTCKIKGCGQPVDKRRHWRRDADGCRILWGTLCVKHRREYYSRWARQKRHRVDPLIGTRKTGTKGIPTVCPKCGRLWDSARAAVKCHNQRWKKIVAAREGQSMIAA